MPVPQGFKDYAHAKPHLIARLGAFCSYCEVSVPRSLAVEHIKHKDGYPALENSWENFLLSCASCNSFKGTKDPSFSSLLLPDRDNTFHALSYRTDGALEPNPQMQSKDRKLASETLGLAGLDVDGSKTQKRSQVWAEAKRYASKLSSDPRNTDLADCIVSLALRTGHFGIWMAAFRKQGCMLERFVNGFPGTRESGCFGAKGSIAISPAPNPDGLPDGGKL